MSKKLRTRNHKVVLNRSAGGDAGISVFLIIFGAFMFLPMYYAVVQSLKPLDELWVFPPKFYVVNPTFKNFKDMFTSMSTSWVPFSRYIFNTVLVAVFGTFGNLVFGSLAAYSISKIKFPGRVMMFR
ncbi:MAG: carbohydrate ABC transporter permease, partial [Clostridia bacterium]|nr:carbohydrate ABC transporter permease [Clostridia bacterium]